MIEELPSPPWANVEAPGVCDRGHSIREDKCPACHDLKIAAYATQHHLVTDILDQIKEEAIAALKERQAHPPKQMNDSSSYEGSMIFHYCKMCGFASNCIPESYAAKPIDLCCACNEIVTKGWI